MRHTYKIFAVKVQDRVLGDEVAELHNRKRSAGKRATKLRETFKDVVVEPMDVIVTPTREANPTER